MMTQDDSQKVGHEFLASLGKTRLRPGGVEATSWLMQQAKLTQNTSVLEIACNMATTSIEMATKYGCKIHAIDMNEEALNKAKNNIINANLSHLITIEKANAMHLPYDDNSFDVVINEAMLTMYETKAKLKFIQEYFRVLKPGGCLLTHDIALTNIEAMQNNNQTLSKIVKTNVSPLPQPEWVSLFEQVGFKQVSFKQGQMSLLSPRGLIKDEGIMGALKIVKNAFKNKANRTRFLTMFKFFKNRKKYLSYIAICSRK